MNCPFHILIFNSRLRSYRELPLRMFEFGTVYRYEKSGVIHGLTRVRGMTQDDAHIFTTKENIEEELASLLDFVLGLLADYGLSEFYLELSTKPPGKGVGTDEEWAEATEALRSVASAKDLDLVLDEGGGAFYGPKIDIKFKDAIGRIWQGPTIQLDFNLPERFELEYTGADNRPHRPVMIHRAIYGTLERFTGNLIEHFAGAFPVWLAPEQVRVIPISDAQNEAARALAARLKAAGLRIHVDDRSETLNYRIREGELQKVPYMAVVGQREAESDSLALRIRGAGKKQEVMPVAAFLERIGAEVRSRALAP
jgi:threonyl-tRNA synthetase